MEKIKTLCFIVQIVGMLIPIIKVQSDEP